MSAKPRQPAPGIGAFVFDEEDLNSHRLDIFSPIQLETSLIKGHDVFVYPTNSIADSKGPIDFAVS